MRARSYRRRLASLTGIAVLLVLSPQGMAKDKANGGVTPPKPIYTPDPEYTEAARRDRVQGTVVVHLNLATDGTTHDIKVVRGLRPDLDKKAVEAVTKWKFQPAMKDGAPVATSITVEVAFRLR
jgi:protein TonB